MSMKNFQEDMKKKNKLCGYKFNKSNCYLGIDAGSTTTKADLLMRMEDLYILIIIAMKEIH